MAEDVQRELGSLEARMTTVEATLETVAEDVKKIRSRTDKASGIAMLVWICIPTAFGAALAWFFTR